jgi:hypothetical protein
MKQSVPPAVIVGVIVAVVAVACFFGFRALFPSSGASTLSPTDYKTRMTQTTQAQQANMEKAKSHAPGGAPAGYSEYRRRQQSGQ